MRDMSNQLVGAAEATSSSDASSITGCPGSQAAGRPRVTERRPSASRLRIQALHRRPRAWRPDAREHVQLLRGESGLEPILVLPVASSRTLETVAELLVDEDRHRRRALLLEGNHVVARVTLAQNPETWVLDATCRSRRERGAATYRLTRALRRPARCYSTFGPKPPAQRKGRG